MRQPCTAIVDVQQPIICQTTSPAHLFLLPRLVKCNFNSTAAYGTPVPITLELYKHNLFKYDVPGWLCRRVHQAARLLTYFFGDEHLKELNSPVVKQGNGTVMSDQLSAKLEALYLRTRKEIDQDFRLTLKTVLDDIKADNCHQPIGWMRWMLYP